MSAAVVDSIYRRFLSLSLSLQPNSPPIKITERFSSPSFRESEEAQQLFARSMVIVVDYGRTKCKGIGRRSDQVARRVTFPPACRGRAKSRARFPTKLARPHRGTALDELLTSHVNRTRVYPSASSRDFAQVKSPVNQLRTRELFVSERKEKIRILRSPINRPGNTSLPWMSFSRVRLRQREERTRLLAHPVYTQSSSALLPCPDTAMCHDAKAPGN